MKKEEKANLQPAADAFIRLVLIMDELREKCPWDKDQTLESLRNLTIEETYELAEAIDNRDMQGLKEELGDILLHIIFYNKIASEKKAFSLEKMINDTCDKLIRRHPHIYGDVKADSKERVKANWESIKLKEGRKSVLEGVPPGLPAAIKAHRMQEKTSQVGFDWCDAEPAWEKFKEEKEEFDNATTEEEKFDEMGDMLFSLINYARLHGIEAESALAKTNKKFKTRFKYMEENAEKPLRELSLEEMELLWQRSKRGVVEK